MNYDARTIERIVSEVMRRVSSLPDPPPAAPSDPRPTPPASPPSPQPAGSAPSAPQPAAPPSDTLMLDARVVTTNTIHGRLKGIRRVVVGTRAVITPSVRDELQKKNIRLERHEAETVAATAANLTIVRCASSNDAARAMTTLPLPTGAVEQRQDELSAAVSYSTQAVHDSGHASVLVTDQALAAVCLLNRSAHVRAAPAGTVEEVREAISAIGVNVLVVDPRRMTANQWNVIIEAFRKDLPHPCPPGL
ncbi:MAG: hypothetical protein ACQESR_27460 [Planctomycetota bacterium]